MGTKKKTKAPTKTAPKKKHVEAKPKKPKKPETWRDKLRRGETVSGEEVLAEHAAKTRTFPGDEVDDGDPPPWEDGMPDIARKYEPTAPANIDSERRAIRIGATVFMAWDPSGPSNDLFPGAGAVRRAKLVGYTKDGKPRAQMFRVDAAGAYTGELGAEIRTFELNELLGQVHAAILPTESAAQYDERIAKGGQPSDAQMLNAMAKPIAQGFGKLDKAQHAFATAHGMLDRPIDEIRVAMVKHSSSLAIPAEGYPVRDTSPETPTSKRKTKKKTEAATPAPTTDNGWNCNCSGERHKMGIETCLFNADGSERVASKFDPNKKLDKEPNSHQVTVENVGPATLDPKCPKHGLLLIPTRSGSQKVCPAPGGCGWFSKKNSAGTFDAPSFDGPVDHPNAKVEEVKLGGAGGTFPITPVKSAPQEQLEDGRIIVRNVDGAKCPTHKTPLMLTLDGDQLLCRDGECTYYLTRFNDKAWLGPPIETAKPAPAPVVDDVMPMLADDVDDRPPWEM